MVKPNDSTAAATLRATPFAEALDTLLSGWGRKRRRLREWQTEIEWNDEVLMFPAPDSPTRVRLASVDEPCFLSEECDAETIRRSYGPGSRERYFTLYELEKDELMAGEIILAKVSEVIAVLGPQHWRALEKAGFPTDVAGAIRALARI